MIDFQKEWSGDAKADGIIRAFINRRILELFVPYIKDDGIFDLSGPEFTCRVMPRFPDDYPPELCGQQFFALYQAVRGQSLFVPDDLDFYVLAGLINSDIDVRTSMGKCDFFEPLGDAIYYDIIRDDAKRRYVIRNLHERWGREKGDRVLDSIEDERKYGILIPGVMDRIEQDPDNFEEYDPTEDDKLFV